MVYQLFYPKQRWVAKFIRDNYWKHISGKLNLKQIFICVVEYYLNRLKMKELRNFKFINTKFRFLKKIVCTKAITRIAF